MVVVRLLSWRRPSGQDHLSLPMKGALVGANLTDTIL